MKAMPVLLAGAYTSIEDYDAQSVLLFSKGATFETSGLQGAVI